MPLFFRKTSNPRPRALMVFDYLGIFSFLPIIKIYKKLGAIQIFYLQASSSALMITRVLIFFKVIKGSPCKIKDLFIIDNQYASLCQSYTSAFKISHANQKIIEETVEIFFPGLSKNSKDLLATGVKSNWIRSLSQILWLKAIAEQEAANLNLSKDQIVIVSEHASLMKTLKSISSMSFSASPVLIIQQMFRNDVIILFCKSLFWSLRNLLFPLFAWRKRIKPKLKINNPFPKISFAAIWGIELKSKAPMMDDLFWLKSSGIPNKKLAYIYDRPDYQPTTEKTKVTDSLGIQSFVSDFRFSGNSPHLSLENIVFYSFWASLKELLRIMKRAFCAIFLKPLPQSAIAISNLHFIHATHLASYFKALNIKGVIHYQQAAFDTNSLAAEFAGACRFGFLWSCIHHYGDVLATSQVTFVWGRNDAMLQIESGCISKHMLIAGCLLDKPLEEKTQKKYMDTIDQLRYQGASYYLGLFPGSTLSKDFYSYFFNWIIEDPKLGLLIKPKGDIWLDIQTDGLDGLVQKALTSGRVHVFDSKESPAYIGAIADFSVGIGTYSAAVLSALRGARVLYVDYERLDQGKKPQPYNLLHSLGPNRCVFYDFDSVKKALLEYFNRPESNPDLGNASSVLDLIDPFQDGRAKQRIGEYIGWYLEGLENGLSRDDSMKIATKSYSKKWGEDKVVLGLDKL